MNELMTVRKGTKTVKVDKSVALILIERDGYKEVVKKK